MAGLKDRVVLITGASSGVGARAAIEFATFGSKLALHGRDKTRLQKTLQDCMAVGLPRDKIFTVSGDVTKKEDVENILDSTVHHFGELHVVVHSAGATRLKNYDNCDVDDLDWSYNITLRSTFLLTKLSIPHLQKTKGNIVHVASMASKKPQGFSFPFSIASAGRDQFTKAAAIDIGRKGIRVNSINLSVANSDFFSNAYNYTYGRRPTAKEIKERDEIASKSCPAGRICTVDEAARTIAFLASDDASFIAGATLPLDGSYSNLCYAGAEGKIMKNMDLSHK